MIISENVEVIWTNGDPASAILNTSKKAGVDLLIKQKHPQEVIKNKYKRSRQYE